MRVIYFLFLVAFLVLVGGFAYYNQRMEDVTFYDQHWAVSFPTLVGATYLLGMLTGWAVVGMLRRSWSRVVEVQR